MKGDGLSIQDMSFRYPAFDGGEEPRVLRGLNYSLELSGIGVVLGGADSGKTTLARIISGLVPRFTGGEISGRASFRGSALLETMPYELTGSVGIVFQNPDEQLIAARGDSEVAFALESLGVERGDMRRRVDSALELMGLSEMRSQNPATLSGGEKKRLLIACLAAVDPDLWVLDEAFEELDGFWKARLLEYVRGGKKTALFLDSRWWPQYEARGATVSFFRGGEISFSAGRAGDSGLTDALVREGLRIGKQREPAKPASADDGIFIEVLGARFRFSDQSAFSLEVERLALERGVVSSIIGRNGSGKSTLGKILCGLIKPQSGCVLIHDRGKPHRTRPEELNRRVGYMFQNPDYQIFLPTVYEELALGLKSMGLETKEAEDRIEAAIRIFRLPSRSALPSLMSYGARKRLQAATYFLLGRELLVLDEIDAGLSYKEFFPMLEALAKDGAGLLIVTQDLELARSVSGRIISLDGGRISRDLLRGDFHLLEADG